MTISYKFAIYRASRNDLRGDFAVENPRHRAAREKILVDFHAAKPIDPTRK
jgi:hypothetical protein